MIDALQHPEINSLELHTILTHEKEPGETFADFDRVGNSPMVVKLKKTGRTFRINDDPPNTGRDRPIEELRKLC